jgi:hypothetical protein
MGYEERYFFRRLRFSFFMRLRCHFQRICPFFFQRLELLFIQLTSPHSARLLNLHIGL